jgi:hypothetical protein
MCSPLALLTRRRCQPGAPHEQGLGRELVGPAKSLDVTMAALHRQLSDPARDHHIADLALPTVTTLRGYGYRLESPRSE